MSDRRRWARATLVAALAAATVTGAPVSPAAAAPVPGTEASSPALESLGTDRLDVFSLSGNDVLQQYNLPGGSWRRPFNRGGTLASQPTVVSWGPGRLDIFARGTDSALWHRWLDAGKWSAWESLGGTLTSAPAVASWAPGRLDVFARTTGDVLYQRSFSAGSWSAWRRLTGVLTSSPAVTATSPGRLHIVARSHRQPGGAPLLLQLERLVSVDGHRRCPDVAAEHRLPRPRLPRRRRSGHRRHDAAGPVRQRHRLDRLDGERERHVHVRAGCDRDR